MLPVDVRVMLKEPDPKLPSKSPLHVPTSARSTEPIGGRGAGVGAVGVLDVLLPQAWSTVIASAVTAMTRDADHMLISLAGRISH